MNSPQIIVHGAAHKKVLKLHPTTRLRIYSPSKQDYIAGWGFYEADVRDTGGKDAPVEAPFTGGVYLPTFASNKEQSFQTKFKVPVQYADLSSIYPVIEFSVLGTSAGVVRWGVEYTVARGFNNAGSSHFDPSQTVYLEQAIDPATDQLGHFTLTVEDVQAILPDNLEPGSAILARVFRDVKHVNDTYAGDAYFVNYGYAVQTDRFSLAARTPDFDEEGTP